MGDKPDTERTPPYALASPASRDITVGLLADPDLPARLATELADVLPERLHHRVDHQRAWRADVALDPFEAMFPDYDRIMDKARERVRDTDWDIAFCLTDLPLRTDQGVLVAKLATPQPVALISIPALGGIRMRHRLADIIEPITQLLAHRYHVTSHAGLAGALQQHLPRTITVTEQAQPGELDLVRRSPGGQAMLLGGMVRANRPWRLIVGLSRALAGATAGAAFGVLYSTIWQLATALGPLRLAGTIVAAVAALAAWLIVGHSLWEHAPRTPRTHKPESALRNAGTLTTVAVGTTGFFTTLFVITLAAAALVIPPTYLGTTLGHAAHLADYLRIALMASVLGTVAGAVGSGLEDDTTVRKAAYGHRERERRERVERQKQHTPN